MLFGPGYIQRTMFVFVVCTILACICDGAWLGVADYGTMRTLTYFWGGNYGGWAIPLTGFAFIAALPQMLLWDYSFFHSLGAFGGLVRVILSVTISIGFVWGFATMLWPIIANYGITVLRAAGGAVGAIVGGLLSRF